MATVDQYPAEFLRKVTELFGKHGLDKFVKIRKAINDNSDLTALVVGTTGAILVTDNGDDSITLSITLKADNGLAYDANGIYIERKTGYGIDVDSDGLKLKKQAHVPDASTAHSITDPVDAPATADVLRDDLVANAIPEIKTSLDLLGAKINTILSQLETAEIFATS